MTKKTSNAGYEWKFCTMGGVTRVKITSGQDIAHLGELDQKLWTVLSCPVKGLEFDEKTLSLMDTNHDEKLHVYEIQAAAKWLTTVLKNPDLLIKQADTIKLSELNQDAPEGLKLYNSAKQILANLGLEKDEISLADASDSVAIFAKTAFNGDGIITGQSTEDEALKDVIQSAIDTVGSLDDRSGLKGIDTDLLEKFYTACSDYKAWKDAGTPDIFPYGDGTADALAACQAIKDKVADYFMRCKLASFSKSSTEVLDVSTQRIGEIGAKDLVASNDEIAACPIARITGNPSLPLDKAAINPAWHDGFAKVKSLVIDKEFPGATALSEEQWNDILAKFTAFTAWNDAKKGSEVESLGLEKIEKLLQADQKAALLDLIAKDKEKEEESAGIDDVEKFMRFYKNFYKLLKNFVTLTDFYSRLPENLAVFQAGTLYIDQRSTELCVKISDMGKQGEVSELSGMYVLYCDCTSKVKNQTITIAAVLTDGDVDNLRVGKNAIFYDREGHDWDAVITKIVDNPISVRQAFWSPYRKLARFVYDRINKTATEKNSNVDAKLTEQANTTELPKTAEGSDAANPKVAGFDIAKFAGIFAAIGMAVGFIANALVSLAQGITAKWYNLPLLIIGIIILISGPSMFLAWQKLRKRNLTPLLNANGWAINSHILVNIPFGKTFTNLAQYPKVKLEDPYGPKKMSLGKKIFITLLILIAAGLAGLYFTGHMNLITDHLDFLKPAEPAEAPADAAPADAAPADAAPAEAAPAA